MASRQDAAVVTAMPIYEYLCPKCNRVFNFLAKTLADADKTPACPKCGSTNMKKRMSGFSVTGSTRKSSSEPGENSGADPQDDDLDPRTERELDRLMAEAENIDENDPRQLGGLMRRMADVTGEPMDAEMEEAVRRLESGEDPEKIEEDMGEYFDEEEGGIAAAGGPTYDDGLYSF